MKSFISFHIHGEMFSCVLYLFTSWCLVEKNYTVLSSAVCFFSESAKGSDSEDDFLRQKTKSKVASDSDSDSDIGRKKRKKPSICKANLIWTPNLSFNLIKCI